jgi:hypothetical protein
MVFSRGSLLTKKGKNVKTITKMAAVFGSLILLSACQGMDYYSPYHYYSDEPNAPTTAPTNEYSSYDSHSSASAPTRRSHGAQYTRPAAPSTSSTEQSASASTSNSGALSKTPRFEEKTNAPPPPVVQ